VGIEGRGEADRGDERHGDERGKGCSSTHVRTSWSVVPASREIALIVLTVDDGPLARAARASKDELDDSDGKDLCLSPIALQ
jgi:hypothetical protein